MCVAVTFREAIAYNRLNFHIDPNVSYSCFKS